MTGEQLEDSFIEQVYTTARAVGDAARAAGKGVICAHFVLDDAGLGTFDLCTESLDFKTLTQVALRAGTLASGRCLFELFHQTEDGEWDALFSEQQFDDFTRSTRAAKLPPQAPLAPARHAPPPPPVFRPPRSPTPRRPAPRRHPLPLPLPPLLLPRCRRASRLRSRRSTSPPRGRQRHAKSWWRCTASSS